MIELPFDKWSLNFSNKEFELLYEETQQKNRLFTLRVMSTGLSLVALSCLILFIIQHQPAFLIVEMGAAFGGCFLTIIISNKLVHYLKQAFDFFYLLSVGTSLIINYSGIYVPHYVYGYCASLLFVSILQNCHNHFKIAFIIITPSVNLGLFGVFDIDYLQYILLTITAVILFASLTYQIEYTSRLQFSQSLKIEKHREILFDCVTEPMFSMIQNERANALNISFQNKKFKEFLNLNDKQLENEQMTIKEFLRNSFVTHKSNEYQLIEFIQRKEQENEKILSLEDFLFKRLVQKEGNIKHMWQEDNIIMMRRSEHKVIQLDIRKLNYGRPIIFVMIQLEKLKNAQEQQQEREILSNKVIVNLSKNIADSQEILLNEINTLQYRKNDSHYKKLQVIQCFCISIITMLKNYTLFFSQNRIQYLIQTIDICKLNSIISSLQTYFQCRANQNSRQFKIINNVSQQQVIKINSKILIQLILNIFEISLKYSLKNDSILLKIQIKSSDLCKSRQIDVGLSQEPHIQIFQFSFSFITTDKINLFFILPESTLSFNQLIQEEHQIAYKVSSSLLGMIGPYNHIEVIQTQLEDKSFYNTLMLEIYQDQTKLDPSFVKFNKKY